MIDPRKAVFEAGALEPSSFAPNSRYQGVGVARLERPGQKLVAYLRRRFVPPPENFVAVEEHPIVQGDRLDNLAARYLGDPELWWRLTDANGVLRPDELIERIGRRLSITLPQGIPGVPNA